MSIKLMAQIWDHGPQNQGERFVLLALADFANDTGECWPSITGIRRKTCMSERGVQTVLRRLEDAGWLEVEMGGGRKNCNRYTIKTPQEMPPHEMRGNAETPQMDAETPQMDAENPAPDAPEPSRTIKNHQSRVREKIETILSEVLRAETSRDFFDHRKAMKKPLTERAAQLVVKELRKCRDPDAVANLSIMNGWQGVFPEREQAKQPGRDDQINKWRQMAARYDRMDQEAHQ